MVQLTDAWALYRPLVAGCSPLAASPGRAGLGSGFGLGRNLLLQRLTADPARRVAFRPLAMVGLQAAWLSLLGATGWGWYQAIQWVAATHITSAGEPDLVGYAVWSIFLSLGFFRAVGRWSVGCFRSRPC